MGIFEKIYLYIVIFYEYISLKYLSFATSRQQLYKKIKFAEINVLNCFLVAPKLIPCCATDFISTSYYIHLNSRDSVTNINRIISRATTWSSDLYEICV